MKRRDGPLLVGALFLMILTLVQGFYATELNRLLYTHQGPINDSAAYLNRYAEVVWTSHENGLWAGLREALEPANVLLPYLEGAVIGTVVTPSRIQAIWLQELWVLALVWSLYWYLLRRRRLHPVVAVAFTAPVVSFATVYWHSGGISDFRMDLSLYILLALTAVWYLAAREGRSWWPWPLFVAAALLTVLARATAAAYLAVLFGPLLLADLALASHERRRFLLRNLLLFGVPAVALVALYYGTRFDYLYRYYFQFVRTAEPTVHPERHFWLGLNHLGSGLKLALLVSLAAQTGFAIRRAGLRRMVTRIEWRYLWLALAPGLLLTLTGAGLNPLVSLPMVFGVILFCLLPLRRPGALRRLTPLSAVICALLAGASLLNASLGVARHRPRPEHVCQMSAYEEVIPLILEDSRRRGRSEAAVLSTTLHCFSTEYLRNVLIYDHGGRPEQEAVLLPDGFRVRTPHRWTFSPIVPRDWQQIPGDSDDAKLEHLVNLAQRDLDYILLPDQPSTEYLEQQLGRIVQHQKVGALKRRLLATGDWEQLGGGVCAAPDQETLILYRKRSTGSP